MQVYLDNSATTRQYDEVTELMYKTASDFYGNPSSLHRMGLEAEKLTKEARSRIASALGADDEEICFTACGTESDNTVLFGAAEAKKRTGKRIIISEVEHPAILEPAKKLEQMGFDIVRIGVDKKCRLNLDQLRNAINNDTILISIMAVNNETGTIMPIREIAEYKNEYNRANGTDIWLHTDAVQALGKIDCSVKGSFNGVDFISASAHKIHGPKGMGVLYKRKGLNLRPFMLGGGQEKSFRSGTENVPGICGFGLAALKSVGELRLRTEKMAECRKRLQEGLCTEIKDIVLNSPDAPEAVSSVLNISFLGTRGEVILHTLEQDGVFVSTGSACSSNHVSSKGSHVLNAMGLKPQEIEGAIRFSLSEFNTIEEMDYAVECVKKAVNRFRKLGSFR